MYVSIIKHEINKMCFCRPRLWRYLSETHFLTRLHRLFQLQDLQCLILPCGYQADDLCMSMTSIRLFIYFFHRRFGYTSFRLRIKFSVIHVYAHTCACTDKAAQMYFGSMNYGTHIYITSNYHIVIKPAFSFARTTCARQTFSGKVDRNS